VIAIKGATKNGELEPILDMQGGGRDLIFPHHFMTKIIVEKLAKRDFAAQYVHTGLLGFNGEKMSKSLGNLVFVHELLNSGVDPMAIRLALLSGKYSEDRMWTDGVLDQANSLLERMRKAFSKIEVAETTKVIADMIEAISDDLNTPKAISILSDWCDQTLSGGTGSSPGSLSRFIDSALGLAI
jgi:L-cysteine:1D-myo-inositol 2-amino-2-deoxy-alpha-D-glucopyranoside ligase